MSSSEEHLIRYVLNLTQYRRESNAWKQVGVVSLTRAVNLLSNSNWVEGASASEYTLSLFTPNSMEINYTNANTRPHNTIDIVFADRIGLVCIRSTSVSAAWQQIWRYNSLHNTDMALQISIQTKNNCKTQPVPIGRSKSNHYKLLLMLLVFNSL